jgi:hypothetical protein
MDVKIIFAIIASCSSILFAFIPYLKGMLKGEIKPHSYTWLIWSITMGTALTGLWKGDGGWAIFSMLIGTIGVFIIFLFSLKYGTRDITMSDTITLALLLFAILVWWQLENLLIAVVMVSIIDIVGYFPSFRKSYADPWSEKLTTWAVFSFNNYLCILALREYNFLTLTYLLSISSANIVLIIICLVRRKAVVKRK